MCIYWCKPDGTNCFIVVDGRVLLKEDMGQMVMKWSNFRRYGCVRGYNLDGGGSVTMILRDPDGSLTCKNNPDGWERTVETVFYLS